MTWPETNPAPSLTRNETVCATSSGTPTRRTGMPAAAAFLKSSKPMPTRAAVAAVMSVTMKPGATALAVTPNLPSSMARVLVKPCRPGLGGRVVGLAAVAEGGGRGEIDDPAETGVHHVLLDPAAHQEGAAQMDAE